MEYSLIVIFVALAQYIFFTGRVGFNREKYNVTAPKTAGDDMWERMYRVQQNSLEQIIIFIPGMVVFSLYISEVWVLLPGVIYVVGRQVYSHLYIKNPASRGLGMILSFFSNIALVIGSLYGLLSHVL